MTAIVFALGAVLLHRVRELRGQAELAQIKSTLGALRTALVVAHLEAELKGVQTVPQSVLNFQHNPFTALQQVPSGYAGLAGPEALASLPGGSWVFDPACRCIGYQPLEPGWLQSPVGAVSMWFRVGSTSGPLQIDAQQPYVWMDQLVE